MATELLERLTKENVNLREDFTKLASDLESTKNDNVILADRSKKLEVSSSKAEKELAEAKIKLAEFNARASSPAELDKALTVAEANTKELKAYRALGPLNKVTEALDKSIVALTEYKGIGAPKKIIEALDKSVVTVRAYKEYGTLPELKTCFEKFEKIKSVQVTEIQSKAIAKLAAELKISEAKVKTVYGKLNEAAIRELFQGVNETSTKVYETFKKTPAAKAKTGEKLPESMTEKSSLNRLMESLS